MSLDKLERMVIIVMGLPGSGKSYLASRLAAQLGASYVSSDLTRKALFSSRQYTEEEKLTVYQAMLTRMTDAITAKKPIVLDATFYKASIRRMFDEAAECLNENIIYIEVIAPEWIIEDRLKRPRTDSEADYGVYLKIKSLQEPLPAEHLTVVSSNDNISAMLDEILEYIRSRR